MPELRLFCAHFCLPARRSYLPLRWEGWDMWKQPESSRIVGQILSKRSELPHLSHPGNGENNIPSYSFVIIRRSPGTRLC